MEFFKKENCIFDGLCWKMKSDAEKLIMGMETKSQDVDCNDFSFRMERKNCQLRQKSNYARNGFAAFKNK